MFRAYTAILVVDPSGSTPYTTLQSAINAAVPGQDEVFASCGFYHERVTMRSGVNLRGSGPHCTTIDGTGFNQPAIEMPQSTLLEGFTVRKGGQSGISVSGTSTIIRGNVIEDNNRSGIIAWGGSPVITRNVIRNNHTDEFGGGIWRVGPSAVISANLIVGNVGVYGGGVYVGGGSTIANNTIVGNSAMYGGGIFVATAVTPDLVTVASNVVVGNGGQFGFGGGVFATQSADVAFIANDVYQNDPDNYFITSGPDPTGTNGNVSVDPLFVDMIDTSFVGFQPRSDSPLVDNGSPASAPERDLRGIPIPVDGNADGTARVDVGARENEGLTRLRYQAGQFVWDPGLHQPQDYNVYRGDLETLRSTGVYTQDPSTVPGARYFCDIGPHLADVDTPESGHAFFYIAVAWGVVEGTLGFDSRGVERPRTRACLGP
jgi:hypothetical protein